MPTRCDHPPCPRTARVRGAVRRRTGRTEANRFGAERTRRTMAPTPNIPPKTFETKVRLVPRVSGFRSRTELRRDPTVAEDEEWKRKTCLHAQERFSPPMGDQCKMDGMTSLLSLRHINHRWLSATVANAESIRSATDCPKFFLNHRSPPAKFSYYSYSEIVRLRFSWSCCLPFTDERDAALTIFLLL